MSTSPSQSSASPFLDAASEDEIDLRQVAGALGRQRRLIAAITGASLLLSGLYALIRKPVWEGQFQIVLESQARSEIGRLAQMWVKTPFWPTSRG